MAQHIASVVASTLPLVTRSQWFAAMRPGDLVFCSGAAGISVPIERETNSPFSHVLKVWTDDVFQAWMTLESTIQKGVHLGSFDDYANGYNGHLVLCRRPLSIEQVKLEMQTGRALLGDAYDWVEEVSMAVRKLRLFAKLPPIKPKGELYCSGLQQLLAMRTIPFVAQSVDWLTPEQLYTDPSVTALCALAKA